MASTRSLRELGLVERLDRLASWKWFAIIVITAAAALAAAVLSVGASWLWWLVVLELAGFITIKVGPWLEPLVNLFAPMWMPVLVLLLAAYALFVTDQGRDVGVGLLDTGQVTLAVLAAALFYWASGTWHAARLALDDACKKRAVTCNRMLLRWLPRLLGACAHFYATITIALAARHIATGSTWFELIYFVPSGLIAAGTAVLWWHDKRYMAARGAGAASGRAEADGRATSGEVEARRRLRHAVWTLLGLATMVIAVLVAMLEYGFVAATSWVLVSAALFLFLVGHREKIGELLLARYSKLFKKKLDGEQKQTLAQSKHWRNLRCCNSS